MRPTSTCLASLVLFASIAADAADWSQFRGPDGGKSSDTGLPLTWSASENIVWKSALPGRGASSPVVFGDQVYLTAWTGYGMTEEEPGERSKLMQHVLCLSRKNGEILWNMSRPAAETEQEFVRRVADHGYATGTPACDESGVYAYFGVSGVVAYDPDGEFKWAARVGDNTRGFGSAASPILFGDLVIMNASIEGDAIIAFDKHTGAEVWRILEVARTWTTPTIVDVGGGESELIVSQKEMVRGFDPRTGQELWNCAGVQDYVVPCVVANAGVAYVIGGRKNQAMAIRCGGRGDVTETNKLWEVTIGANVTSPIYFDGHLYCATDKAIAWCLDASNGATVYRERLPTRSRVYASAILADGRIYATTRDRGVAVIRVGGEYEELARNEIETDDSLLNATPAISNGQILLRTDRFLYCIGE